MNGVCVGPDTCSCDLGFTGPVCDQDIDECLADPCDVNATCTNSPGSFSCACNSGYTGAGDPGDCLDIDECLADPCDINATCTNSPGSYSCACNSGYTGAGDPGDCLDIDECLTDLCDVNATCTNSPGSFSCACNSGYTGTGDPGDCLDVDECLAEPCDVNATCTNSPGSFGCTCNAGYTGTGDPGACSDIDECATAPCPVNATCTNLPGSFDCVCITGWTGSNCDVPICDPPCANGMCVAPGACTCDSGWTGGLCDVPVCTAACLNGTCTAPDTCACDPGFGGPDCSIPLGGLPTIDIKPGACPNTMSRKSGGVLPVAIVAPEGFDIADVDPASLLLFRADGVGAAVAPLDGPPGPGTEVIDVATPFGGGACGCHDLIGDGIDDLLLSFTVSVLVEEFNLATVPSGTSIDLMLSGDLFDGTSFQACDAIRIVGLPDLCGDGICERGENCKLCPADCGSCARGCGNGRCTRNESCVSCPADCGECP